MARSKSHRDILRQNNRLNERIESEIKEALQNNDSERVKDLEKRQRTVNSKSLQYIKNMTKQKSYERAFEEGKKVRDAGDENAFENIRDKTMGKQWSRNTYMGLSNG